MADLPEKTQSEFNAGIDQLYIIGEIKRMLSVSTAMGDYNMQFRFLRALFKELMGCPFKQDERQQMATKYMECREVILRATHGANLPLEDWDKLDEFEIYLRIMAQEAGLNMPTKKDSRYALGRR